MLCSSSYVSRIVRNEIGLTTTPIECFHGHTNFFHELTRVDGTYSSDGFMGPTSYSLGPMLCSSSDVSRIVGNEIRPENYSNRMLPWSYKFLS